MNQRIGPPTVQGEFKAWTERINRLGLIGTAGLGGVALDRCKGVALPERRCIHFIDTIEMPERGSRAYVCRTASVSISAARRHQTRWEWNQYMSHALRH